MAFEFVDPIHIFGADAIQHGIEAVHGPESKSWGPPPTGFRFDGFDPPQSLMVDHEAVSQGLANAGLACSANNAAAVAQGVTNLGQSAPRNGLLMRQATTGANVPEWHWHIRQNPPWEDYMSMILSQHAWIEQNNVFPVQYLNQTKTKSTSTNVAIQTIFNMVAQVAGDLEHGHVDIPQLSKQIASHVTNLAVETSDTYHVEKRNQTTFMASEAQRRDGTAQAISGTIYNYTGDISDHRNKKTQTHRTCVHVEKWSMIFTDEKVFTDVYNRVRRHSS